MRYDVTIIGNHQSTQGLIGSLMEDGLKPDLVVTLAGEARQKVSIAGASTGLADWSRAHGIEVYECAGFRLVAERDRDFFSTNSFGIGVCTDWQHLIPAHVLEAFDPGIFGFHGSLMEFPNGRGRSPFNWSLRLGGEAIYHNCFRYTEGADEGEVFNTTRIDIGAEEPIGVLRFKALVDSRVTVRRLLHCYKSGGIPLKRQPSGASVWLPKLTPEDSRLQFHAMTLETMLGIVRASSHPFAGAFFETRNGARVTIWRASRYEGPLDPLWSSAPAGAVLLAAMGSALFKCCDGFLLATELSVEAETLAAEEAR